MLVVLTALTTGAWLVAAGVVFLLRRPPEPPVGQKTLDLGPEPPALANFLVHGFRVTSDAVPATLLDLAARNVIELEQRGPGVYYVRLRATTGEELTSYEHRVLELLEERASDGVVPAGDLTTGPKDESSRWRKGFDADVVTDAKRRGLSRDAVDGQAFTVLTILATLPAVLVWIQSAWQFGAGVLVVALALLGKIRAWHTQRETPAGLEAAARWLGVRAALLEDEEFKRQTPITVEMWNRHLAYGAALGAAPGAIGPLPMGVESDTHAWSAYGGRWRPVRVAYPNLWPPGWGTDPLVALFASAAVVVGAAVFLYFVGAFLLDGGSVGAAGFVIACGLVVGGVAVVVMAWSDWLSGVEVTGPILRLRAFGDEKHRRYYVAVDDGRSSSIRAWRVSPSNYANLAQGEVVTARLTPRLGCVRWIIQPNAGMLSGEAGSAQAGSG
jgi:Predicted membrane protein (DUF2207)